MKEFIFNAFRHDLKVYQINLIHFKKTYLILCTQFQIVVLTHAWLKDTNCEDFQFITFLV